ncbi:MAG: hypothetical protein IH595_11280 [Bacteroidales bacterium]|nr:hypothetical protein [Bacteroidales bacterium]
MKTLFFITVFIFISVLELTAQNKNQVNTFRIAFYNTENFFDTEKDTSSYNQFDRGGDHNWNLTRYHKKEQNIYKAFAAMGGWKGLSIIGLAEIENEKVLSDLITNTPLQLENYQIIHYDSHDFRGIDVALLYRPKDFTPLFSEPIRISDPSDRKFKTRDILYVKGLLLNDTIHLFINHWTSRYEGLMKTIPRRKLEAKILTHHIDSIFKINSHANIIVMGDFNENPDDQSVKILTQQLSDSCSMMGLPASPLFGNSKGTIKSGTQWSTFDQLYISKNMNINDSHLFVKEKSFHIFDAGFLLEKDEKNLGYKPARSYIGFKYHGGYSDHLPIFFDVSVSHLKQP